MGSQSNPSHHAETHEIARGAFINLIGNLGKFSHFAFDLLANRVIGQSLFGYFSTTWLLMHLSFIVCYFGAHRLVIDFVVKSQAESDENYYRGILSYIILSLILSALLVLGVYCFADDLARYIDKPPVADYMKILVWCAPFYTMTTILLSATRGRKVMKLWVFVRFGFEPFLDLILLLVVFFIIGSVAAPFWAKAISFTLGSSLAVFYFNRHFSFKKIFQFAPNMQTWKRIFSFGFPVMVADFISVVILKVDIIPLSILAASPQVAVFQVILNAGNNMRFIPQAIDPIMMPIVVEMRQRNDMRALENIFIMVIRSSLFLAFGFFIMIAIFGDFVLTIFADDFAYAAGAMTIACFGIMIHTVCSNIEPVLVMSGYPYLNLFNNIVLVVVNLTIDFILIPTRGIYGAAIGSLTACTLTSALQLAEVYWILKIKPLRWDLFNIFWLGGIFYVIFKSGEWFFAGVAQTFWFEGLSLIFFVACYLPAGWKWFLHDGEREMFTSMISKKNTKG